MEKLPYLSLSYAALMGISFVAGLYFLLHFINGWQDRSPKLQYLFFSLMSLLIIGFMGAELSAYYTKDAASYVKAFQWRSIFALLFLAVWPWFIYSYTAVRPRVLALGISFYLVILLIPIIIQPYGAYFDELPVIASRSFSWGESITFHEIKKLNSIAYLIWSGILAIIGYTFFAAYRQYKKGQQRQAIMLASAMTVFGAFFIENFLVRSGLIDFIFLAPFGFPSFILIMGLALHHETRAYIKRITTVFNNVPAVIYMKDRDGKYSLINRKYETLFNVKSDNVIGKTDFDIHDKALANSFSENDKKILTKKHPVEFEEKARQADGLLHTYHSIKFPLIDENGEPYAVCGISTDITDSKQKDVAVSEAQMRYRSLVESTAAIPWEMDLETWCFTYVGQQAEEVLGYPVEQWYEKDFWTEHIYEKDREYAVNFCKNASLHGENYEFEYRMKTADGRIVWLQDFVMIIYKNNKPACLQGYMFDITERKHEQASTLQSESKFRTLFETASDAIFLIRDEKFIDCNPRTHQLFGCKRKDIIGNSPRVFSPPTQYDGRDSGEKAKEKITKALDGKPQHFEWLHARLDGTLFDAEISLNRIELDGKPCLQAIVRDVSARRRSEAALRDIAAGVSGQSGDAFFKNMVLSLSKLFAARHSFIGLLDEDNPNIINTLAVSTDGIILENLSYPLEQTPCEHVVGQKTCTYPRNVQKLYPQDKLLQELGAESYIGTPLYNNINEPIGLVVIMDNKPMAELDQVKPILEIFASRAGAELERVQAEKHIRRMAFEDYLTGLANRAALHEHMSIILKHSAIKSQSGAMILIDLDHFKTINDALSHDVGDHVLKMVGQRLQDICDEQVYLARVGGDEFVAILNNEKDMSQDEFERHTRKFAQNIVTKISKPLHLDDRILSIGASIGIVSFPEQGKNELDIMRRADMALYRAKNLGRGNIQFYESSLQEVVDDRLQIERGLRHAIAKKELKLHYQPQFNVSGEVIGAEALLRWSHSELGEISTDRFIPVAEETGLIHSIGEWVINEACRHLQEWQQKKILFNGHLAINVSAWQFSNPEFVTEIINSIAEYNLQPQQIVLELTETALLHDLEETKSKLVKLRSIGIKIALDDFGTGYSSLAYLKDMTMDILKIDQAFISELSTNNTHPLVETIISMGQHMNLEVVEIGRASCRERV